MSEATVIKPDLQFVNEIIKSGGESLKKCYQCATCSVVCNVTPEGNPFPRKEMVLAQWGQKDKLIGNPDIWLCHQCSDCTAYCPRGAKPGEVLGAIRKMTIRKFSGPSFLARMVGDPKFFLFLMAVPVLIYVVFLSAQGFLGGDVPRENDKIVFGKFLFSLFYVDPLFTAALAFAAFSLGIGVLSYWKAMNDANPGTRTGTVVSALTATISDILAHSKFKKCEVTKGRSIAHMLVFYSFIGLFITTLLAFIKVIPEYFEYFGSHGYTLSESAADSLTVVYKIIGNVSAVALIVGIFLVMLNRFSNQKKAGIGSYYDWLFIVIVAGVGVTGMLAQLLRIANMTIAYPTYVIHLCFVFFLFAYAPFSKMAHMVYRTTAMVFAKYSGRDVS